jgi:hypothetical protein
MYNALILSDVPIDKISNDKLWKLKIPLRIKVFGWYLRKGVVLTKDNLAKRNWHGSKKCVFCHQDETIKHLFFQCRLARSIWSVIQVASNLFPPCSITNIFGNWLNEIDHRFKSILGWERLPLFGPYGYIEMIKYLMTKTLLFWRLLSTELLVHSIYGRLCSVYRIATFIWRSVHDWKLRRGILFPNMDGRIAYGLVLLVRRYYNYSPWYVILPSHFQFGLVFRLCAS